MDFLSLDFFLFYSILLLFHWLPKISNALYQNIIILIGNYIFYYLIDKKSVPILLFISLISFLSGIFFLYGKKMKNLYLKLSFVCILFLFLFFKLSNNIYNFLLDFNFYPTTKGAFNILLPVGISYYIFKSLSYLFEIKKDVKNVEKNILNYFCFVSFFPCILAGPIDRTTNFLPQIKLVRFFNYTLAVNGFRQILWGLFKKLVIADNCTMITAEIFHNPDSYPGSTLLIVLFLYTIEVYADFSGYSDIAIGVSKTFGINIKPNFNYPFFAKNIRDFWRRWHISLTSWLTDYVYSPLSIYLRYFNKGGQFFAIILNFLVVGLWHGAKTNYLLYGLLHGFYFAPSIFTPLKKQKTWLFSRSIQTLVTLMLVTLTFVVFKTNNINECIEYYSRIFSKSIFSEPKFENSILVLFLIIMSIIMFCIEWISYGNNEEFGIANLHKYYNIYIRWFIYIIIIITIGVYMNTTNSSFLYFKF